MLFFLNELSLHNQFQHTQAFLDGLIEILRCRQEINRYRYSLYCDRRIAERLVCRGELFQHVIRTCHDNNLKRQVLSWLDKEGPFWDEVKKHDSGEYFTCKEQIVTDYILGEVAYRKGSGEDCYLVSFRFSEFEQTPIEVKWYKSADAFTSVSINNFWLHRTLQIYLTQNLPNLQSWDELVERIPTLFPGLTLLNSVEQGLKGVPFNLTVATQVVERLGVLQKLSSCFDVNGNQTLEGHELMQQYVHGGRLFSDESEQNKQDFHRELTFVKPNGELLFCPFHAKISHMFFRVHFSWPIVHNQPIYIAYIGPKITKH